MRMRFASLWVALCSAFLLSASAPSTAETNGKITTVIELFTSQGCSSCPPADRLLQTYATQSGVLVLSMHVDYWDYLGWKDTYGRPELSQRQRTYAKARGDGAVYTPQAVINGLEHANGSDRSQMGRVIDATTAQLANKWVSTSLGNNGQHLVITLASDPSGSTTHNATVWLALFQDNADVPVKRGENNGKTLTYVNVVRDLMPVGMWTGAAKTITLPLHATNLSTGRSAAVLLQESEGGPIIGAATLQPNQATAKQ